MHLCDALSVLPDIQVTLLTQGGVGEPVINSQMKDVDLRIKVSSARSMLRLGLPVRIELNRIASSQRPSLIHSNGLWVPVNHWAARLANRWSIPLLIQPHGMLEPWALSHNAWKKRIAMGLFQRRDLGSAKVLVSTSSVEYENIRKLGFKQPIALIPNGVSLNLPRHADSKSWHLNNDLRTALFLSRVHPVKGLLNLVHAWSQLLPNGWHLRIVGPNEGGHLDEVMALVRQIGISESVEYLGEVDGERKSEIYYGADLFVLPTYTENFGVAIAEALAHGLPVITTRGAPWADLETYRCGWWIDIGVDPLVQALRQAIALTDKERQAMGERGREYVKRYDWNDIARQTIEVYRWVLGQGSKPDCVYLD